ncbi:adipokinetic hormone/corazonin-related peptide receptor variant I-like [Tachypleus tridentatus]|uniref:adipokinetic hormone/corazonin-related peptide receptor variant I-like n=1 Tax=Tachypleus tridentatus TaxID=6853 RepID=UPI003FD69BFE
MVPLAIIIYCYSRILWVISRRSHDNEEDVMNDQQPFRGRLRLRRSNMTHIERARARTLRMTITIVLAFFWCWTPYVVIVLWYQIDLESAKELATEIQSALFMFAVSNSCVNPLVYGSYAFNFKDVFRVCYSSASTCPTFFSRSSSRRTFSSNITRATHLEAKQCAMTLRENSHPIVSPQLLPSCQCRGHPCPRSTVNVNAESPGCVTERSYV